MRPIPRRFSRLVAGLVALLAPGASEAGINPIHVGGQKQLFIDRRFIESSENIALSVNPPIKRPAAVIKSDRPWDAFRHIWYSVAQDGETYKMWYQAFDRDQWGGGKSRLCYAVSKNLFDWEKPSLGLVEYEGAKENNILIEDIVNGFVFVDPQGKPEQRYKLIYTDRQNWTSVYVAVSADGLRWDMPGTQVAQIHADTQHAAFWDTRIEKYVVYFRPGAEHPFVASVASDPPVVAPKLVRPGRQVARLETEDLLAPWPVEEARLVLAADERDPDESDIYTHYPYQYPFAADAYFLFPLTYQHFRSGETTVGNDGVNDTQFAASRDGVHWMRYDRRAYVERGLPGDPDCGAAQSSSGTHFRIGNYLYQFYGGWPFTHGGFRKLSPEQRQSSFGRQHIYLVVQRLDGFVSADAPYDGGWLVTPPLRFDGRQLELNINVTAMGEARVELQEADGRPIPGFGLNDCQRILKNDVAHVVQWGDRSDVAPLAGRPIRLRIAMRSARLYAFQFTPGAP